MFDPTTKLKFLFKCEDCGMIVSVDLEDEEDVKEANEDKMILACPCGGKSKVLRN
jgi:DNA-directed RNA polymerase subunit RPC12/RpoP